jgi:hypothetical protein
MIRPLAKFSLTLTEVALLVGAEEQGTLKGEISGIANKDSDIEAVISF